MKPKNIGVVITTYNSPEWLELVLLGYECQIDNDFKVLIADDGSGPSTKALIEKFISRGMLQIEHFWQQDDGFQKTKILNSVIDKTDSDYLIFTDGDCVPRQDFISVHREFAEKGYFLSGGYLKLTQSVSDRVDEQIIKNQNIFDIKTLISLDQPVSFKLSKMVQSKFMRRVLNRLTPTKPTWNGMNSSGWRSDICAVNGFDERMQYGGLDRELGERLWNLGLRSKQIRYSAVCLHLDHPRGYSNPATWERNRQIRQDVKDNHKSWTDFGIRKKDVSL
jgi:glycosyltransferase involved in cell wall biosynthesis